MSTVGVQKKSMVKWLHACDNPACKIEWFHFDCVGLYEAPAGNWFCSDCDQIGFV